MGKGMRYFLSVILLFSFSLIGAGFFLSYKDKLIDPFSGILSTADKSDLVNVTNNGDEKKPISDNGGESNNSNTETGNTGENANNNGTANNNSNNNNGASSSTTTPRPTPNPTPAPTPAPTPTPQPTEPTIDDVNNNLRTQLQNKYGVSIKYGNETSGYSVGGMSTSIISDSSKISKALSDLSTNLANYPDGFFKEFNSIGLRLTIYLIDSYSDTDVTGVTDPSSNNVIISIATYYPFSESFNHETYHYMERYIKIKGGVFTSWQQYNPSTFRYGSFDSSLSFAGTSNANSYFVNDYAQTNEFEDRASTFEYMMADTKASCMNYNLPIWNKANYMSKIIDVYFNTVNSSTVEHWERFL